jgi:nuclear pore complex protein Nup160
MLNLYTEITFQAKPSTPASLVRVQVPRLDGSYRNRPVEDPNRQVFPKNEKAYAAEVLSSQTSLYFREKKAYPRTFLWKVVDSDHVLQVQCADLARAADDTQEAHLTLSLEFQDKIIPSGVVFSDTEQEDVLYAFVLTHKPSAIRDAHELHTIAIPSSYFRNATNIQKDAKKWCSTYEPSSFSMGKPYKLHAHGPFELFISFEGGKIQKLKRPFQSTEWAVTHLEDRGIGSTVGRTVGRLVKWGAPAVVEGDPSLLSSSTAHAMVAGKPEHLYTLCLNHTLRVWHLVDGTVVATKDLLDKPRYKHDNVQIKSGESGFIKLIKSDLMSHAILVTYSPLEGGQFKFWDVRGGLTHEMTIEDKYPDIKLSPPDPDPTGNTIWTVTGFEITHDDTTKQSEIWVMFRNNNYHQLYSAHFDFASLPEAWTSNWVQTSPSVLTKPTPPDLVKSDAQDPTSKWLDFILFPGRYPAALLHTALSIYETAMSTKTSSRKSATIQERLVSTVAATVALRKYSEGDIDCDRFVVDTDFQWRNFWRIIERINDLRQGPVSLSVDVFAGMPWITMADQCSAVRECSTTELLGFNAAADLAGQERLLLERWPYRNVGAESNAPLETMAGLISTSAAFRKSFAPELALDISDALAEELQHDPEFPVPYRINDFYERVNFNESILNETFHQLEADIGAIGGLGALRTELFLLILETLPQKVHDEVSALRTTVFGSYILCAGMQESITSSRQLVFDLLMLVIFLEGEINHDDPNSIPFDAAQLYVQMTALLREYDKNLWLISHVRLVPLQVLGDAPVPNSSRRNVGVSPQYGRYVTILEDAVAKAIRPQAVVEKPQSFMLTDLLGLIESWINGNEEVTSDESVVYIQCDLIGQNNISLASDFLRFQSNTAWSTYVKGRLRVARAEYDLAARYFQKAAYALACGRAVGKLNDMSAGLLSLMDAEHFNSGMPLYYQHVLELFEVAGSYTQMARFARLALQSLAPGQKEPVPNFRSNMLSRLFTAELKESQFMGAFDALIQFSDVALQKKSLVSLVTAIIDPRISNTTPSGALRTLQRLPIAVYPHLAAHMDQHLLSLSKKQTSVIETWSTNSTHVDYLKILHAIRVSQGDHRGSLSVLLDRVRLVKKSSRARGDPQATELRKALLTLINAMTCVEPDEAYILTEAEEQTNGNVKTLTNGEMEVDAGAGAKKTKRVILTLDDLRREYQKVLDRCSRIERGDFDFGGTADSDEDEDEDVMEE